MVSRIHPRFHVAELTNKLDADYIRNISRRNNLHPDSIDTDFQREDDPLVVIEHSTLAAVRNNDITTANLFLRLVTKNLIEFVEEDNARAVLNRFLLYYQTIFQDAINKQNYRIVSFLITRHGKISTELLNRKFEWNNFVEFDLRLEEFIKVCIEKDFEDGIIHGFNAMEKRARTYIINSPDPEKIRGLRYRYGEIKPYDDDIRSYSWRYIDTFYFRLKQLGKRCAKNKNHLGVSRAVYVCENILNEVLNGDYHEWIVRDIVRHTFDPAMGVIEPIYKEAIDNDIFDDIVLLPYSSFSIPSLGDLSRDYLKMTIISGLDVLIHSTHNGCQNFMLINEFGTIGRELVEKEDEAPIFLIRVFGFLGKELTKSGLKNPEEKEFYKELHRQIKSIRNWRGHERQSVITEADIALNEFSEIKNLEDEYKSGFIEWPSEDK